MWINRETWPKASPWNSRNARSRGFARAGALLLTALLLTALTAGGLVRPESVVAAQGRDAYQEALGRFKRLTVDKKAGNLRQNWLNLDRKFVAVYRAAPKGPEAPKALFYRGWVHQELAKRSFVKKDYAAAAALYGRMAERFPTHSWTDDALLRRAEISRDKLGDTAGASADLIRILKRHPNGDKAEPARKLLAEIDPGSPLTVKPVAPPPEPAPTPPSKPTLSASPEPEPAGMFAPKPFVPPDNTPPARVKTARTAAPGAPASLAVIQTDSGRDNSRVTLTLDKETTYRRGLLKKSGDRGRGRRLYIDLDNAAIGKSISRNIRVGGVINGIRTAYNRPGVVRVVLDIDDYGRDHVYTLANPFRVVLDIAGRNARPTAVVQSSKSPTPSRRDPDKFSDWLGKLFTSPSREKKKPVPAKPAVAKAKPKQTPAPAPAPAPAIKYTPPPGSKKRLGDLVEQLGLTVKTIMIDPGHGGKDPGAQKNGLTEKRINLRFAKMLGAMLKEHGFNILYTRTKDVFIPLGRRTEMANTEKADLFISIHCNANPSPKPCGLETYSLNLAGSKDAVRVAARENAVSAKQISDLQLILSELALNSKIKESRDLAATVQKKAVQTVRKRYRIKDRGPHEAPFYVLMGARMPAILVELGYLTNKAEAKRLKSDKYLRQLARGLVNGIVAYKKQIERFAAL